MKNNNDSTITIVMIVLFLLLVAVSSYGLLTGKIIISNNNASQDPEDAVTLAKSRIGIGDSRTDAVISLSDAWFHSECTYGETGFTKDLFFYGSHDLDEVQIVIISSRNEQGITKVTSIGSIENYMLHLYDRCIPNPSQAFDES